MRFKFLLLATLFGVATAQLQLQKVEDIEDGPVTGGSFLLLDQDPRGGEQRVVGMVRHFQVSGGPEIFGRRFGPRDAGTESMSINSPFDNLFKNIDNHFAAIDELHDQLVSSINCPKMREKVLNEMLRRSLILGEEVEEGYHQEMHEMKMREGKKKGGKKGGLDKSSSPLLGADESSWGPFGHGVMQGRAMPMPNIYWIDLEDTAMPPPEMDDPIDWRLWQDGHLNLALLCFMALTAACVVVWSALLVQCCSFCNHFIEYDDYYYDAPDQFMTQYLQQGKGQQEPLLNEYDANSDDDGGELDDGKKVRSEVESAADYAPPGEYVRLQYVPLKGDTL